METEELNLCMGCMSKLDENGKCRCGYDAEVPVDPACLTPGTTVGGRYLVGRMLEMNGEGITYIGFDKEKEERVFVREFMPQKIAGRNELTGIILPLPGLEPQYKTLLSDYRDLCVALQNLRHCQAILPVLNVFTERNTAYAVYKYVKTISYGDYLLHNGGEFTWAQVKKLFMPLFTSISNLHAAGVLHRGINPKSIRVNARGQLLLCGFGIGAVRTEGTELDSDLSAGYAAPEQYSQKAWQGPWTDVYSVAAVLYKSLTGTLPTDARSRMEIDRLCPPEELNPYIPTNVAKAIHHAMQTQVDFRTQSVDQFTAELLESPDSNTAIYETHPKKDEKGVSIGLEEDTGLFPERIPEHKKAAPAQNPPARPQAAPKKVRTHDHAGARWGLITGIVFLSVLIVVVTLILKEYENTLGREESSSHNPLVSETEVSGEETVTMPNFIGRMRKDVEGNLIYEDFSLTFEEEYNAEYPSGMIFDQSVNAKASVQPGMTVTLKVSKGPETTEMPNFVGQTVEDAEKTLKEKNITYQLVPNYSLEHEYGVIYSQTDENRVELTEGSSVVVGGTTVRVYLYYGANERANGGSEEDGSGEEGSSRVIVVRN